MGTRPPLAPLEFYHLYNRGADKRKIFLNKKDYERFLVLLYFCNSMESLHLNQSYYRGLTSVELFQKERGEPLVDIAAYCLMPNHFHILVRQKEEGGISKFMQKLTTGYTMYFNKKNERSGVLFQGKFKSEHVAEDRYLKYLLSYIHLNPVKLIDSNWKVKGITNLRKAEAYLDVYPYSSYAEHTGKTTTKSPILNKAILPEYFVTAEACNAEMREWLQYTEVEPR